MDRLYCAIDTGDVGSARSLLERFDGASTSADESHDAAARIAEEMAAAIG